MKAILDRWGVSTALGKLGVFILAGVVGALVAGALSAVHDDRVAARNAREALVRELTEQVTAVGTSRLIVLSDNAPSSYLYTRCRDLRRDFKESKAVEDACDKAVVDALLQEQELGNAARDVEARLLVLSEVARGEYETQAPSDAIQRVRAAARALRRLIASNDPATRATIVRDLEQAGVVVAPEHADLLVNSVISRGDGRYDVNATEEMQTAYEAVSAESEKLTGDAVEQLRTAELRDRSTTYSQAFFGVASDPLIIVAAIFGVILVLAFRPWDKAQN